MSAREELPPDPSRLFVRGGAIALYAARRGMSEAKLADEIYAGVKSQGAGRQRLRRLKQRPVTILGTRDLDAAEEARRLVKELRADLRALSSDVVFTLTQPERGLVKVGGAVVQFSDRKTAAIAAVLVEEAGRPLPNVHATTQASLESLEDMLGTQDGWRTLADSWNPLGTFQYLLDVDRYLEGDDSILDALAWSNPRGLLLEHLAAVFQRVSAADRHMWWLWRARKLIDRAMEIKAVPDLEDSLSHQQGELYAQFLRPWDESPERMLDLERRSVEVMDAR